MKSGGVPERFKLSRRTLVLPSLNESATAVSHQALFVSLIRRGYASSEPWLCVVEVRTMNVLSERRVAARACSCVREE